MLSWQAEKKLCTLFLLLFILSAGIAAHNETKNLRSLAGGDTVNTGRDGDFAIRNIVFGILLSGEKDSNRTPESNGQKGLGDVLFEAVIKSVTAKLP